MSPDTYSAIRWRSWRHRGQSLPDPARDSRLRVGAPDRRRKSV